MGVLDWRGRLGRRRYAAWLVPLTAASYALLALGRPSLLLPLVGVPATLRRLRDASLAPGLAALLLVPAVNVLLVALLALAPPRPAGWERPRERHGRLSTLGSAAVAVAVAAAVAVLSTYLGANLFETYGFGLFLGVPYALGLLAALLHGSRHRRDAADAVSVSLLALLIASIGLVALALEGLVCLVMALPITVPLAVLGGLTGHALTRRRESSAHVFSAAVLALPLVLGAEGALPREPQLLAVTTSVVVHAEPETVWRYVVAVEELPPPREPLFRAGLAYPTRATLDGEGVGAVRRCTFSTGDFVEPITVWDEPRRLAFDVVSQPAPLRELSPFGTVEPPHLHGFFVSERGEFRLTRLDGGRTLLSGTSWYRNRMWPAAYWELWSDALVHRIHRRVLEHVAARAEGEERRASGRPRR